MYGYGYRYNSGLVVGSGGGGAPFANTYSLDFDGVDTSIQIPALDIDTTSDLTLSCWVKSNGFTTWDYLCTNGSTGGTNSLLNLRFSGGGALFSLRFGSSVYTGLNGFADGNWHHIAMTINYTNGDVKFYKDGVVSGTVLTWGSVGTIARIASIGAINSTGSGSMSGSVDEFAVFEGLQNISDLYNGGTPTDLTDLSPNLWLRMGDNGAYKSPQFLLPNNENKDKVSNYSFELDGVDDKVSFTSVDLGLNSTVSLWVKRNTTSGTQVFLGEISYNSNYIVLVQANKLYFRIGTALKLFGSASVISVMNDTTNWINIVFVRQGDSVELFLNGVSMGTETGLGTSVTTKIDTIGDRPNGGFPSNAKFDEVALFDSAISIGDLWDGSGEPTTLPTGAVAHYKMGEEATFSTNWTVPDQVGSNDGTSANMTIEDRVGEAPNSENNALSYNMDEVDRVEDTP